MPPVLKFKPEYGLLSDFYEALVLPTVFEQIWVTKCY